MKRVLLCAALIVWSGMASAVVYKWMDAQGKLQYGDRPPDGVHAEIVELPGNHIVRSTPAAPPPSQAAAREAPSGSGGAKRVVDADVAQTREKQCAEAQARYKKLIESRKLYKAGADGERDYLTSAQIDAERLDAKRDVDSICNSTT